MSATTDGEQPERSWERKVEALFRQPYDLMFKTACKVLGNTADAEDVVQGLFLKFIQSELREEVLKNPKAYLRQSAVNPSLNSKRSPRSYCFTVSRATPTPRSQR